MSVFSEDFNKVLIELIDARALLLITELSEHLSNTNHFALSLRITDFVKKKQLNNRKRGVK